MATQAFIGSQTLLKLGDGASPEVFTTIGEVTNIGPLAQRKDLVEATHMTSTAKEFIGGLSEGQEIAIECNYVPNDAQQVALLTAAASVTAAKNFKYTYPVGAAGGSKTFSLSALVLSSSIGPTSPNGITKVGFGLKVTGAITGPA